MTRLPRIPYEIKNQIYYTLCQFGCARWKSLLVYAEALSMCSDVLPEDVRTENAEGAGFKAVTSLISDERIKRIEHGDEKIAVPIGREDISYVSIYAFDAFAALVREIAESNRMPEMCYAGRTENYPFHYIFAAGKQEIIYRVIVYGPDSISRIGFLNSTYNEDKDKRFVTMLVVPEAYSWEEFTDINISGKARIALISKANRINRTYKCVLTDVIEEQDSENAQ